MKNKLDKKWVHNHVNNFYVKLAKKEGYRARSIYKLQEIDAKEKLIQPGQIIVDLGSSPGSWSQYIRQKLSYNNKNINGTIIALDILKMKPIPNVNFILGDFRNKCTINNLKKILNGRKLDLILSDISPNLSGISVIDSANIKCIINVILEFTKEYIKPSGSILLKCFYGNNYKEIFHKFYCIFKSVSLKKPKASHKNSSEIFLLGKKLKNKQLN
ncbi:ribosomal RNA large subunit methyltransferase E [Candidatus Profftella armatura (Diaphorina cf. continua)]|uniref:Ribosomal RNA large subunit methyltransferase E n=2 Tax=Candidatus Profftella armatura (Diaphorina cf. continua) TaxID=2661583 RepID=A0A7R6VYK2_9PROT|nr:ribosomal RNA large subunit methyltransferase E [Candidatus Profftella armatura (Diaphorina cf. continua)]